MLRVCPSIVCELDIKENGTERSEIVEAGISDVSKFRLKIETRVTFGDGMNLLLQSRFWSVNMNMCENPLEGVVVHAKGGDNGDK